MTSGRVTGTAWQVTLNEVRDAKMMQVRDANMMQQGMHGRCRK